MNELEFKSFLINKGIPKKVISDHISKLKRLECSINNCDLDIEYERDKCNHLLILLSNKGNNEELKKVLIAKLPIGTYAMNTFKYSIKKYIEFKNEL